MNLWLNAHKYTQIVKQMRLYFENIVESNLMALKQRFNWVEITFAN